MRQKLELALGTIAIVVAIVVLATMVPPDAWSPPAMESAAPEGSSGLVIAEVVTSNGSVLADDDGDFSDWVELLNLGGTPVSLDGHYLSDATDNPQRWRFPDVELDAGGRLLVWLSGKDRADPDRALHTDFSLAQRGESLLLSDPDGTVLDHFDAVAIPRNASFGRSEDDPTQLCFFEHPTALEANAGTCHDAAPTDPPEASHDGGFYDDAIELTLQSASGMEIYYTLDGSYPDPTSNPEATQIFDTSLTITDRSDEPDQLSAIPTAIEDPAAFALTHGWAGPDQPGQKATVLRARTPFSAEIAETYFVGADLVRDRLPVVSLATDPDHLFDETTGIYVPGDLYTRWHQGPDYDPEARWFEVPANFHQGGRDWERPAIDESHRAAIFTYCDPDAGCTYTNRVGLRVHGGVSRTYPFKSFRLYARNAYGERSFEHPLFGEEGAVGHRRLLLRNSGNDWNQTMLRDGYLHSLVAHLDLATQNYQPTVVFLNGEYWGVMNLRERFDPHYLSVMYDVDPTAVAIVSRDDGQWEIAAGKATDLDPYLDLLTFVDEHDLADPDALEQVDQEMDLDNLIDYLLIEIIAGNRDWPGNNSDIWRTTSPNDTSPGSVTDGRWRWLLYDLDQVGGGAMDPTDDTLARITQIPDSRPVNTFGIPLLLTNLLENDAFRQQFLTRATELLNTAFEPGRAVQRLDELETLLADEMERHTVRWPGPISMTHWRDNVDLLRTFMQERPDALRQQFIERFDLPGLTDLRVQTSPGGTVTMDNTVIEADTPGVVDPSDWTATVFEGIPVALTATPRKDFRFVGWEGLDGERGSSTNFVPRGTSVEVTAVFEPR